MKWIYTDKNKGKFFTIVAVLLLGILIGIRVTITVLYNLNLIPNVFNNFKVVILGLKLDFDQLILGYCFFGLYLVLDGFLDGIPISLIEISSIFIMVFTLLQSGKLIFILFIPFSTTSIAVDLSIFILIILFAYIGVLIFEVYIFWMKTLEESSNTQKEKELEEGEEPKIYTSKEQKVEYKKKKISKSMFSFNFLFKDKTWINPKDGTLYFEDNEYAITDTWKKLNGEYRESFFQFFVLNILILLGTGFIYGVIRYFLQDIPAAGNHYDYFSTGLFFPVYTILITSFLSIRHFIRALLYLFSIILVTLSFWEMNLITINGTFIFSKIIAIFNLFFIDLAPYFNMMTQQQLYTLYIFVIGIIIQIQFLLLVISNFIRYIRQKGKKLQIFSSNKYLYIRDRDIYNPWMLIFELLAITLWPFNPNKWRSFYNKLEFKIHSIKEGMDYNYGRLSYLETIKKMKKIRPSFWKLIGRLILLISLFIFTISYLFGYIFLAMFFIEIWRYFKNEGRINLKAKYRRRKAQGSIFKFGNTNVLYLYRLSKDTAALIPPVKFFK